MRQGQGRAEPEPAKPVSADDVAAWAAALAVDGPRNGNPSTADDAPRPISPLTLPPRLRLIVVGALALLVGWLIVTRTLVAYLADSSPETALWLRNDPVALLNAADRLVVKHAQRDGRDEAKASEADEAVRQAGLARAAELARRALALEPLNARALRILGQTTEIAGDKNQARRLMAAALRLSHREGDAAFWSMLDSYERRDHAAAVQHAGTLLGTQSRIMHAVAPVLAWVAEAPEGKPHLDKLLLSNPAWRDDFLTVLPDIVSDARTPLGILLLLKKSRAPPTTANVRSYVDSLLKRGLYELAYYTWLQFLPADRMARAGFITNGELEEMPSGLPFDWTIAQGVGVTVDLVPADDRGGQRAMRIEFGEGRVDLGNISQLVLLGSGAYALKVLVKGRLVGRRGLEWRISCEPNPQAIIGRSTPMSGTIASWTEIEVRFVVPAKECRAQRVQLVLDARSASERIVSGTVWYDSFRILRREQP